MPELLIEQIKGFRPRMSEPEFERWVLERNVWTEWVDGAVILSEPSDFRHSEAVGWLFVLLGLFVSKYELGRVKQSHFMVRLPKRRRLPDIFFVGTANKVKFARTYFQGAPDLIIEVVSPDSESRDWREKYLDYQGAGVREYWVVDPASKHAEFYQLKRGKYVEMVVKQGIVRSQVVKDFWIETDWLWMEPAPNVYELAKKLRIV